MCSDRAVELGLKSLQLPRARKVPARYTGPAATHAAAIPAVYYKPQFYEMVDMATSELSERFTGSIRLQTFMKLESILITGQIDRSLLGSYTELNIDDLEQGLPCRGKWRQTASRRQTASTRTQGGIFPSLGRGIISNL